MVAAAEEYASCTTPFVTVVILNYNGLRFLDDCLESIARLDYPSDRYEVILVDNVSRDGSVEAAEKRFPRVRIVRNSRNLGFAAGNNVAMRASRADYVALLNNDTAVDRKWLSALVEAAEQDPTVGICTSKLLFRDNRLRVTLETSPFRPSDSGSSDQRELGVQLLGAQTVQGGETRSAEFLEGFYGLELSPRGAFRWSAAKATLGLRVPPDAERATLRLTAVAPRPDSRAVPVVLKAAGEPLGRWELDSAPRQIEIALPWSLLQQAGPVIQNAGTLILMDGSGRDRGTLVRGTDVYQEDDLKQYDRREEVFAGCGAAALFRKAMLEDVGLFDEDFFMYYEDMDLSWRARRRGWRVLYVPEAVVRHVHAASSVEWSTFFMYHVERNRLLMLAKNAPLELAGREHLRYAVEAVLNSGRYARSLARRSPDRHTLRTRIGIQLRVLASLAGQLPRTAAKRYHLRQREVVPSSELLHWMVRG